MDDPKTQVTNDEQEFEFYEETDERLSRTKVCHNKDWDIRGYLLEGSKETWVFPLLVTPNTNSIDAKISYVTQAYLDRLVQNVRSSHKDQYERNKECPICMEEFLFAANNSRNRVLVANFMPCCGAEICLSCFYHVDMAVEKGDTVTTECPLCRRLFPRKQSSKHKMDTENVSASPARNFRSGIAKCNIGNRLAYLAMAVSRDHSLVMEEGDDRPDMDQMVERLRRGRFGKKDFKFLLRFLKDFEKERRDDARGGGDSGGTISDLTKEAQKYFREAALDSGNVKSYVYLGNFAMGVHSYLIRAAGTVQGHRLGDVLSAARTLYRIPVDLSARRHRQDRIVPETDGKDRTRDNEVQILLVVPRFLPRRLRCDE